MCDFNNLNDEEKLHYHTLLTTCAKNYGGINFFLQLIEALRDSNTHPLCSSHQDRHVSTECTAGLVKDAAASIEVTRLSQDSCISSEH